MSARNPTRVFVSGLGAVSPAGWGVASLWEAVSKGEPLPAQPLERPGLNKPLSARNVPPPASRPAFLAHPRLRRASPISQYAAGAALEAISALPEEVRAGPIGLVMCLQSGPVQYASRFYDETLKDPATASPLLFPETVFAAPSSHIAALLGNVPMASTLIGDPSAFLDGLALGVDWLCNGKVRACLVVGAEEFNWLHGHAVWHFDHHAILSSGAGALCLSLDSNGNGKVELEALTDPHPFTLQRSLSQAAAAMRAELPEGKPDELLCDSTGGPPRPGRAENAAWQNWPGRRISPRRVLGESLMASGAWQCVIACEAVARGSCSAANVSIVGLNAQAAGARFKPVSAGS